MGKMEKGVWKPEKGNRRKGEWSMEEGHLYFLIHV